MLEDDEGRITIKIYRSVIGVDEWTPADYSCNGTRTERKRVQTAVALTGTVLYTFLALSSF